jgi:hypothetical protein
MGKVGDGQGLAVVSGLYMQTGRMYVDSCPVLNTCVLLKGKEKTLISN